MKNKWIKMISMLCFMFVFLFAINLVNVNASETEQIRANENIAYSGSKAIKIRWGKVAGADGYEVYFRVCDGKSFAKKDVKVTKKNSIVIKKFRKKAISNKKAYKARVNAYKMVGGKKVILASTDGLHVVGSKNPKETNIKAITAAKKEYTLQIGKSDKFSYNYVKQNKKKSICTHGTVIKFYSADKSIVSVDGKGNMKAIAAGTTTVYAVAPNGLSAKATVTVPDAKPKTYTIDFHWAFVNSTNDEDKIILENAQVPGRVFTKYEKSEIGFEPKSIISDIKPVKYGTLSNEISNKQITVEAGTDLTLYFTRNLFESDWYQYPAEVIYNEQWAHIIGLCHQKKGTAIPDRLGKDVKKFGYYDEHEYLPADSDRKEYQDGIDTNYDYVDIFACDYDLKNVQEDIDLYILLVLELG